MRVCVCVCVCVRKLLVYEVQSAKRGVSVLACDTKDHCIDVQLDRVLVCNSQARKRGVEVGPRVTGEVLQTVSLPLLLPPYPFVCFS
jgi:hypothetical protein